MVEYPSSSRAISTGIQSKYDVFLSFRGEDVRNNFISHFHAMLRRKGIERFNDDELRRGEEISPALFKAIEESSISIIVFSKNYAASKWCLRELLKILECTRVYQQIVMPIFYHVDPSDVRKQTGSYAEAFNKHEMTFKDGKDEIQRWKDALIESANLSGWDFLKRSESEFIEEITKDILRKLNRLTSIDVDGLVGIETRVERIESSLCAGSADEVRILGIWGMGGIGKTTVARALFDKIKHQFDGCCFLENVREDSGKHGLPHLQEKLLSKVLEGRHFNMDISCKFLKDRLRGKKVLIVLDDINEMKQLEHLAGAHDWFGVGSRIIITTRDKQFLKEADEVYEAKHLIYEEALLLFSHHAFRKSRPPEDYLELSIKGVDYASGIPLALKVLGSSLRSKDKPTWESKLAKLERYPDEKVQEVLKLSFDELDLTEKEILLDVACFFKGWGIDFATEIWDGCDFFPRVGLATLIDKCLLTYIYDSQLWMHDLIEDMGKAIVRKENIKEPGKRSRLWEHEDILDIFKNNTGTETIECIIVDLSETNEVLELGDDAFEKMKKLRFLMFVSRGLDETTKIRLPRGLTMLPNSLRYLSWDGYPYKFLATNFDPQKLVGLSLQHSCIRQLWKGQKIFKHLKWINLGHSKYLFEVPDLSGAQYLEDIFLEGCTELSTIHPSINTLSNLISLNLRNCRKLRYLPSNICLKSLRRLILSGCSNLQNFPVISGYMEHLSDLLLDGTAVSNLPSSIENLTGLLCLDLKNCKKLTSLPDSICKLKRLERLILSGCSNLQNFPDIFYHMEHLYYLSLDGTAVSNLPTSIENLTRLFELNLNNCKNLESLPDSICNLKCLQRLKLSGCEILQHLPENIGNLESLNWLHAGGTSIKHVPPSIVFLKNIEIMSFGGCRGPKPSTPYCLSWLLPRSSSPPSCMGLQLPPLVGFQNLYRLDLGYCNLVEVPSGLDGLSSLFALNLSGNNFESLPQNIYNLPKLHGLVLNYCTRLRSLPELPPSLGTLLADECTSLESAMSFKSLHRSGGGNKLFKFTNCLKLKNQCNSIVESIIQGVHLGEKIMQNFYDQVLSLSLSGNCMHTHGYRGEKLQHRPDLDLVVGVSIPGSRIPEWFSNETMGNSITLHLPPHSLDKCLGFAVCVVLSPNDSSDYCLNVHFRLIYEDDGENTNTRGSHFFRSVHPGGSKLCFKDDHLVFGFISKHAYCVGNRHLPDKNHVEARVKLKLGAYCDNGVPVPVPVPLKVKKCAARLVVN